MTARTKLPKGISVYRKNDRLTITRKWFNEPFVVIWVCFWDFCWLLILVALLSDFNISPLGSIWNEPISFVLSLFPDILRLFVPFWGTVITIIRNYYVIAGFINETIIDVDNNLITIRHRPLPFGGNVKISTQTIAHLYVTRFSRRGRITYNIRSIITGEKNVKLLSNLTSYQQTNFINQEIQEFLAG